MTAEAQPEPADTPTGKPRPQRRWFQFTGQREFVVVTIVWLAVTAMLAAWALWPAPSFDPAIWNDESHARHGARLTLADDIVRRELLSGMSRAQVISLLGKPPPTSYFADWDLVYWLGPERGFISIDSEWLVVRFDAREQVSEYCIAQD